MGLVERLRELVFWVGMAAWKGEVVALVRFERESSREGLILSLRRVEVRGGEGASRCMTERRPCATRGCMRAVLTARK